MLSAVKKTIKKYEMLKPGERVVLGVSGGADSVGLLHALSEMGEYELDIIVAHLNHGIRGEEAERDKVFTEKMAKGMNIKFESASVDAPAYRKKYGLTLEEAARALRYKFFEEIRDKYKADKIATAHTLNDQAETVLIRLIRGSGLTGLSGIPPVTEDSVVRPLIETSRGEIEEYLQAKGIKWIEDTTNELRTFSRNRIRLELIPKLTEYNPQVIETLARTSDILRIQDDFVKREGQKRFKRIFEKRGSELKGDLKKYKRLHAAMRLTVMRSALDELNEGLKNVSSVHLISADEFLLSDKTSGEAEFPGGVVIAKGHDSFLVTTREGLDREFSYSIPSSGKWTFEEFEVEIKKVKTDNLEEKNEEIAFFDPDSVQFPIEVRSFQEGDRFIPLGMKGKKKVKKYFIDSKVPRFLRKRVPIFISGNRIMWLGGMRMDERFRIKKKGGDSLKFTLKIS
jgi:tRNA(Ile)-lysidine synthase